MFIHRIFSMGEKKMDYAVRLEKRSRNIIFHLLYLCFFPSNISYNHWKNESYGFIPQELHPFKGKPVRYPNADFLFQNLYEWIHDSDGLPKSFRRDILEKGLTVPNTFDMVYWESMRKVGLIIKEVCIILAKEHEISQAQYFNILSKYGL